MENALPPPDAPILPVPTVAQLIEAANEAELQASVARAELAATRERAQRFFAVLAAEMRRPSFGEQSAGIIRALLLRAEEASLYSPTLETP